MGKSSIHIMPVKSGSERHNNREQKLNYVREDLSKNNSSFQVESIKERMTFIEKNIKEKTGRSIQKKATPIREGVLLISENHTAADLKNLGNRLEKVFGIKTIQAYAHKDEGHRDKDTNEWKPNYHAHMIFDWTDHNTGKSIKLNQEDMSRMQSIVSIELGLERGVESNKKHIDSMTFKNKKLSEELEYKFGKEQVLKSIEDIKKDLKDLKLERDLTKLDINYLKDKQVTEKEKLNEIIKQNNKGFKRGF